MNPQQQAAAPITVEDLCDRIATADDLPEGRRLEISRDLRRACKLVPELAQSRADGRVCTPKLVHLTVAKTGLTIKRIQNIRASIKAAFRWNAKAFPKGPGRPQLGSEWTRIFEALVGDVESQRRLSRFAHTCQGLGIKPSQVNDVTLDQYLEYSTRVELLGNAPKAHKLIARHWAKVIIALPNLGLQALAPPLPQMQGKAPKIGEFSAAFQTDYEYYCIYMTPSSPDDASSKPRFDETIPKADVDKSKGYKPSVIKQRKLLLRQAGGLLVLNTQQNLNTITLRDLVYPANASKILQAQYDSLKGREAPVIRSMASALLALAVNYYKVPAADKERLESLVKQSPKQKLGMTKKNRDRLKQIGVEQMDVIFDLPRKFIEDAQRKIADGTFKLKDYLRAQIGVAIGLLLEAPVRGANLVSIEIGKHLSLEVSRGAAGRLRFSKTKNDVEQDFPLSKQFVALLKIFVQDIRAEVDRANISKLLFPGCSRTSKGVSHLGGQISKAIKKATGIEINQHLFRHLLALLYLERHPGEYAVVRVLLGHKKLETTMNFYCGVEVEATLKHFANVMTCVRAEADERRKSLGRRGRRHQS